MHFILESALEFARQIASSHHEKWNGAGYPRGIAGEDIPVCARLMAVADVFDALINRRHYKDAFPLEEVFGIMAEGRGTHFDPDILDAFMASRDEFVAISKRFPDGVA